MTATTLKHVPRTRNPRTLPPVDRMRVAAPWPVRHLARRYRLAMATAATIAEFVGYSISTETRP